MKIKLLTSVMAAVLIWSLPSAQAAAVTEKQRQQVVDEEFDAVSTADLTKEKSLQNGLSGQRPDDQAMDEMAKKKKKKKKKKSRAS